MKKIMIICEHDSVERRLNRFVDGLFSGESKDIFLCNINLVNCSVVQYHFPDHAVKAKVLKKKLGVLGMDVYDHSSSFVEKMRAKSCSEINDLISENKINCVLLPVFINDNEHWQYYRLISTEIKKAHNIEILGLIIE